MSTPARATLRSKGQVTLPNEVRAALKVEDGDELEFELVDGAVLLRGMRLIPTEQAWFWTADWQRGEREASEDVLAGRVTTYDDPEGFLKSFRD